MNNVDGIVGNFPGWLLEVGQVECAVGLTRQTMTTCKKLHTQILIVFNPNMIAEDPT